MQNFQGTIGQIFEPQMDKARLSNPFNIRVTDNGRIINSDNTHT
jgi:hypothetical protein